MQCPTCEGDGVIRSRIYGAELCPTCNGERVVPELQPEPAPTLSDINKPIIKDIIKALDAHNNQLRETVEGLLAIVRVLKEMNNE